MEFRQNAYYCFLKQGCPVILEDEPENFTDLPYSYMAHCPTAEIAKMTYQTNLRIMEWRTRE